MTEQETLVVLDFGGQYSHLIARRIRELGVYSELVPYNTSVGELKRLKAKGIVLSGGPASVYGKKVPRPDEGIFKMGVPILGICYGLQLIGMVFGGRVRKAERREYGRTVLSVDDSSDLLKAVPSQTSVWMSHSDLMDELPKGFQPLAHSSSSAYAAFRSRDHTVYAVQFHPEVTHTEHGMTILRNFAVDICGCSPTWTAESFIERAIGDIKAAVGEDRVLCAISGGVDSTTAAVLTHRAVGGQLVCIFVDHGLLRKNEAASVLNVLREDFKMNVTAVDAAARFLRKLKGVGDPERKRRIIGAEFIRVFAEVGKKSGSYQWLVQGTLYPDVIESAKTGSVASRIKTHHNVAGLPGWMKFNLLEPLRWLYKDEVRKVAALLGLPAEIVRRHPFPGPGLAVRVMGEITKEKLRIARDASHIVEEELQRSGWHDKVWQAFAMVGDDKAVGILGDERKYGYVVTIRVVESADAMTADWVKLPPSLIECMSNRITNEVEGVTWVTYAVSSKPPATIEPC